METLAKEWTFRRRIPELHCKRCPRLFAIHIRTGKLRASKRVGIPKKSLRPFVFQSCLDRRDDRIMRLFRLSASFQTHVPLYEPGQDNKKLIVLCFVGDGWYRGHEYSTQVLPGLIRPSVDE